MDYKIADPRFLRNLVLYPVAAESGGPPAPQTVAEAISAGRAAFKELTPPEVDRVVFDNGGGAPVFMLDGEEITGALQNRIITASLISAPRSRDEIGVVCVEENRWDEIGGFQTGEYSYPGIRSILAQSRNRETDVQQVIWREVDRKITVTKTRSKTSSMHDIFANLRDEIDRYLEGFESLNHGTVGFVAVCGDRILGADLFGSAALYRKLERKLIRSYALDAIEFRMPAKKEPVASDFLAALTKTLKPGTKRNPNVSLKARGISGQALFRGGDLIHVSAFPN
jgi:hypothetical protein